MAFYNYIEYYVQFEVSKNKTSKQWNYEVKIPKSYKIIQFQIKDIHLYKKWVSYIIIIIKEKRIIQKKR